MKFFIGMCEANKRKFIPKEPPLDYDHQIKKSYEKKKRQSRSSSSDVPQLGAQKKQAIEPLVVEQTPKQQDFITFLKESNLTAAQVAGGADIPKAQVVTRWQYKMATAFMPPSRYCGYASNTNAKATWPIHACDVPVHLYAERED